MPDDTPILLSEPTYRRHAAAVEYVESQVRTRSPRVGNGRSPGLAPGAWGRLASGSTISAATGLTLGEGEVTLCDRAGVPYPEGEVVTVYNAAGSPIAADAGARIVRLGWTAGVWCVSCPGGA